MAREIIRAPTNRETRAVAQTLRKSARAITHDLGAVVELMFGEIIALDSCNARRVEPDADAIAQLADDIRIRGMLNPLIVRGTPGAWRVLAGGRRWRALKLIERSSAPVRCRVFDGDDEAAATLSLAENRDRENLHPLEEADSVAMQAMAHNVATIARVLPASERWIRERIALSNLPEVARRAWITGEIGEAQARALTFGDAAAVEALFANPQARAILSDPREIRSALAPKGVLSTTAAARFVGIEAYVRVGGGVLEDLFSEEIWLLDTTLLRRLEGEKLRGEANRIQAEEGWGEILFEPSDARRYVLPHFTGGEQARLDEIEARIEAASGEDEIAGLHEQAEALRRRGSLRGISEADRANYGVYVGLDSEGRLDVVRGVIVDGGASPRAPSTPVDMAAASAPSEAAASCLPSDVASASRPATRALATALPEVRSILSFDARRLAEMAASRACSQAIVGLHVGDALRIALATTIAKGRTAVSITRMQGPGGRAGPLLRRLAGLEFGPALEALVDEDDSLVEAAFVEMVSLSVDLRRGDEEAGQALVAFVDRIAPDHFAPEFATQFDYGAFFRTTGRVVSLNAIRDCGGPAAASERSWMKDEQLAEEAQLLARAKAWIPEFLRGQK